MICSRSHSDGRSSTLHPVWHETCTGNSRTLLFANIAPTWEWAQAHALWPSGQGEPVYRGLPDTQCSCRRCVSLSFSAFDGCLGRHEFNSKLTKASCRESSCVWIKTNLQDEVALETRCTGTHHVLVADMSAPHGAWCRGSAAFSLFACLFMWLRSVSELYRDSPALNTCLCCVKSRRDSCLWYEHTTLSCRCAAGRCGCRANCWSG